jgi:hypothetical protein
MAQPLYRIHLTFVRDGGCLWAGNESAIRRFGHIASLEGGLPLSKPTRQQLVRLRGVHDTRYDFGWKRFQPWSPEQIERFGHRVQGLLANLRHEMGQDFEVVYIDEE